MPRKNLVIILIASMLSVACYGRAQRNRFASLFAEAVEQISSKYVREVDERQLFDGAMTGMLGRLDPYSSYIAPKQYLEFKSDIDQEFGGIGIIVSPDPKTKRLMVLSPVVGTPAHRAGVLAGDTIVKVDGIDIEKFTMVEAVKRLRGKPGTDVVLTILHRSDDKMIDITITRAVIKVPSVLGDTMHSDGSWSFVLQEHPRIGYIRLTTFGERTVEELESAIKSLEIDRLDGLILDLRSNAGGLLEVATATCDMFLDEGEVVTLRGRSALDRDRRVATRGTIVDKNLPMAVLINKYSASASEIVAGCLQDLDRAVIVGERSYGKGTVQNVIPLELDKSAMKLTTATFWRPSNKNIHRAEDATEEDDWGVTPNEGYNIPLTEDEFRQLQLARNRADHKGFEFQPDESLNSTTDDQMGEDSVDDAFETPNENENTSAEDATTEDVAPGGGQAEESADVEANTPAVKKDKDGSQNGGSEREPIDDPQLRRAVEFILEANQHSQNESLQADAA